MRLPPKKTSHITMAREMSVEEFVNAVKFVQDDYLCLLRESEDLPRWRRQTDQALLDSCYLDMVDRIQSVAELVPWHYFWVTSLSSLIKQCDVEFDFMIRPYQDENSQIEQKIDNFGIGEFQVKRQAHRTIPVSIWHPHSN